MDGKFFNSRCLVDVIKHMAKVVLDEYDDSITCIHTAILYTRQSSARTINFKNCAKESRMDLKYTMRLDCPDKWIKIFGMLFKAEKYEEAFNLYETKDPRYKNYMEETCGLPVHDDWENARKVLSISTEFFGRYRDMFTLNATSDMYFDIICMIDLAFGKWEKSDDDRTHNLALKIREEYYKYWGNIDELNMLTCIASVLDPTSKLVTIKCYFKFIYNQEDTSDEDRFEIVDESEDCLGIKMAKLTELDDFEYNEEMEAEWDDSEEDEEDETDLDRYLNEELVNKNDEGDFDTLLWWKNNSERFPVLSKIAKDVLAFPMSAVVSHSAMIAKYGPFTGDFRSSLPPSIVEALVCTENWRYEDWRNKWKKAK
nr:zinc finger BED domain-containing protein RICESLEEPER 2-like [Tanacetum cinerariifolium]